MKNRIAAVLCLSLACPVMAAEPVPSPSPTPTPAVTEGGTTARSMALELAGAFSNDGYRLRDGFLAGALEPGKPQFLEVNLFGGNEYWFCGAVTAPGRKISVSVFNAAGAPVKFQTYEDGMVAAAGFVPETSGEYFVRISLIEGDKTDFCLLYSYK